MKVEIIVKTRKIKPNKRIIREFIRFLKDRQEFKDIGDACFNILFCGRSYMKKLNSQFRGIDKSTDVLSFPSGEKEFLGDIAISLENVLLNSIKYKKSFQEELLRVILHGLLHLKGFDHRDGEKSEMMVLQEKILNDFYLKREGK